MFNHWKCILPSYVFLSIICVLHGSPAWNRRPTGISDSSVCDLPSLICYENNSTRCLKENDICNGIFDCPSGKDELNCDTKDYVRSFNLISTRKMMEVDFIIQDVSLESCAKFCRELEQFHCAVFLHNINSRACHLHEKAITFQATSLSSEPSSWQTFIASGSLAVHETNKQNHDVNKTDGKSTSKNAYDIITVESSDLHHRSSRSKRQLPGTCGKRSIDFNPPQSAVRSNRLGRIIGGVNAPAGAYPWQVAIKLKDGPGSFLQWCGGAIIDSRFILTAAHCIDQFHRKGRAFVVVAGEHDIQTTDSAAEQVFEVENFVTHPNYKSSKNGDDIALVKLVTLNGQGIAFNDVAQPICLPTSESAYQPGTMCSVSGWGMQKAGDKGSVAKILQAASVPILSGETCIKQEVYGNFLSSNQFPESMVCAGYLEGKTDACSGDSGGPLACPVDGHFQLLGLVSWGDDQPGGCARKDKPGVYTKTLLYLDWIQTWMSKL